MLNNGFLIENVFIPPIIYLLNNDMNYSVHFKAWAVGKCPVYNCCERLVTMEMRTDYKPVV